MKNIASDWDAFVEARASSQPQNEANAKEPSDKRIFAEYADILFGMAYDRCDSVRELHKFVQRPHATVDETRKKMIYLFTIGLVESDVDSRGMKYRLTKAGEIAIHPTSEHTKRLLELPNL